MPTSINPKTLRGTYLCNESAADPFVPNYDFIQKAAANNGPQFDSASLNAVNAALGGFNKSKPIAMLPIRVETKFIGNSLWIRIFPDKIFIKSLEKDLTNEEIVDGQNYWIKYQGANGNVETQKEAWRFLCVKYGITRTAWIVKKLFPTNVISPATNSLLSTALNTLDQASIESSTNYGAYVGPEAVITFLKETDNSVKSVVNSLKISNTLKMSEVVLLKSSSEYSKSIFDSKYDYRINPHESVAKLNRVDRALLSSEYAIRNSFKEHDKVVVQSQLLAADIRAILQLTNELRNISSVKLSKSGPKMFLEGIQTKLNSTVASISSKTKTLEDMTMVTMLLSQFNQTLSLEYNKINPYKNTNNTSLGRLDEAANTVKTSLENTTLTYRASLTTSSTQIQSAFGELYNRQDAIVTFVGAVANVTAVTDLLALTNTKITSTDTAIKSLATNTVDEYCYLYNSLVLMREQLDLRYDKDLNPFRVPNLTSSGRTNAAIHTRKTTLDTSIAKLAATLSSKSNSKASASLTKHGTMCANLNNPTLLANKSTFLTTVKNDINALKTSALSYTRSTIDNQLLLIEIVDYFKRYISKYNLEINPPKIAGYPSEGGTTAALDLAHKDVKNAYKAYVTALLSNSATALGHFNKFMTVEKNLLNYNINYTRPAVVKTQLQTSLNSVRNAQGQLQGLALTKTEQDYVHHAAQNYRLLLEDQINNKYSPPYDLMDESKGVRNPELDFAVDDLFSTLHNLEVGKDTGDILVDPEPTQEFSFQFSGPVQFPALTPKTEKWTIQQYSDVLPKRFVAIGFKENDSVDAQQDIMFIKVGADVTESSIKFGFNPINNEENATTFDLGVNEEGTEITSSPELSWLFNKEDAKTKGLAIEVPVGTMNYFSKIVVFGVKEVPDVNQHKALLSDLLLDHQYTTGVSLLSVGTPTNNTAEQPSGFNSNDNLYNASFKTFAQDNLYTPSSNKLKISDGQHFAEFLGLPYSSAYHIDGAQKTSILNGQIGARALFPGTIGMHMEEALDSILNHDNRKRIREFFENYVSARGLAPAIRIGNQPYGLLVTSNLHNYQVRATTAFRPITDFIDDDNPSSPVTSATILHPESGYGAIFVNEINTSKFNAADWKVRFHTRLAQVLVFFDLEFRKLAQTLAKNVYSNNIQHHHDRMNWYEGSLVTPFSNYAQSHFVSIFNQLPKSDEFGVRFVLNTGTWNLLSNIPGLDDEFGGEIINNLAGAASGYDIPNGPPWMNWVHLCAQRAAEPNGYKGILDFIGNPNKLHPGIYTYKDYATKNGPSINEILNYSMLQSDDAIYDLEEKLKNARAFVTVNAHQTVLLNGGVLTSANGKLPSEYLNWLSAASPKEIFNTNNFNFIVDGQQKGSRSLLFLLTRAATLAKYRQLAMEIMIKEGLTNWPSMMSVGTPERAYATFMIDENNLHNSPYLGGLGFETNSWQFTKWDALFTKFFDRTPYFLSERDTYGTIYYDDGSSGQVTLYGADIDIEQMFWDESFMPNHPWRNCNLLKHMIPASVLGGSMGNIVAGIFNVDESMINNQVIDDYRTIGDFLHNPTHAPVNYSNHSAKLEMQRHRDALAYLSTLDVAELERITAESVDLSGSRLDAWIHGLFNIRLTDLRHRIGAVNINNPVVSFQGGSYIGAYGYVENLKKNDTNGANETDSVISREPFPIENLPEELSVLLTDKPNPVIYKDSGNFGFLPAPSLSHAVTAAILRSCYETSKNLEESQVFQRSAVNLSSARVRSALFLLQGIQAGNDLGALLGYQFENGLHESSTSGTVNLDSTVHKLRKIYPMRDELGEQIAADPVAGQVVNGLALLDNVKTIYESLLQPDASFFDVINGNLGLLMGLNTTDVPNAISNVQGEQKIIAYHIDQMAQSVDALGDLVITESVYQIVRGNAPRATAAMGMLNGTSALVEPEVIQSPMKADQFVNRVLMNYQAVPLFTQDVLVGSHVLESAWSSSNTINYLESPRTAIDLSLSRWLGNLLESPSNIIIHISQYDSVGDFWNFNTMTLTDLNMQPLDLVALVTPDSIRPTAEMEKWILYAYRKKFNLLDSIPCKLIFENTEAPGGTLSFYEVFPVICQWKELLENAKAITSADFSPIAPIDGNWGLQRDDFRYRISSVKNCMNQLRNALTAISTVDITTAENSAVQQWLTSLEHCVLMGLPGVIPASSIIPPAGDAFIEYRAKIKALCDVALTLINDRWEKIVPSYSEFDTLNTSGSDTDILKSGRKVLDMIFAGHTYCMPGIMILNHNEFALAVNGMNSLITTDESQYVQQWLHANGMVRKNISSLLNLQNTYEIMYSLKMNQWSEFDPEPPQMINPLPVQLPYTTGDKWIGMKLQLGATVHGKCNIMLNDVEALGDYNAVTGFKLDDWNEMIPSQDVVAGIAAHINQPDSEAPQNILLSVPSSEASSWVWNVNDLVASITQAFDMAKYRSLDIDELTQNINSNLDPDSHLGKILPANMCDVFPVTTEPLPDGEEPPTDPPPYNYGGVRPSFSYSENNNQ